MENSDSEKMPNPLSSAETIMGQLDEDVPSTKILLNVTKSITGKEFGRYRVLEELGRGGMGAVYKAYDNELNRTVALKVMLAYESKQSHEIERFLREARSMAKLSHPNIVTIYDMGTFEEQPFFAMEFVEGLSLTQFLQNYTCQKEQTIDLMTQIANAIYYAHTQGVIHRDLKPSNIMLNQKLQPKVMDFGLAKNVQEEQQLSRSGMILGTLQYMPPEQAQGNLQEVDEKSDIYALGAILYEMLTLRPPFTGTSWDLLFKIVKEHPIPPRDIDDTVSPELEGICLKAMHKQKNKRYPSAAALVEDLQRVSRQEKPQAPSITIMHRLTDRARRNKVVVSLLFLLVLSYSLVALYFWNSTQKFSIQNLKLQLVDSQKHPQSIYRSYDLPQIEVSFDTQHTTNAPLEIELYGKDIVYQTNLLEITPTQKFYLPLTLQKIPNKEIRISVLLRSGDYVCRDHLTIEIDNSHKGVVRGNIQRTGVYKTKGIEKLQGVRWKVSLDSAGVGNFSCPPIVKGNQVYCIGTSLKKHEVQNQSYNKVFAACYAIDRHSQEILWTATALKEIEMMSQSLFSYPIQPAPTIAEDVVFSSLNGDLYAINRRTGKFIWHKTTLSSPDEPQIATKTVSSGALYENYLYLGVNNSWACLDMNSGSICWKTNKYFTNSFRWDSGSDNCAIDNGMVFFIQGGSSQSVKGDFVCAIDSQNGEVLWKYDLKNTKFRQSIPAASDGLLYAFLENKVICLNQQTGNLQWEHIFDTHKYIFSLDIRYLDLLTTGKVTKEFTKEFANNKISFYSPQSIVVEKTDNPDYWRVYRDQKIPVKYHIFKRNDHLEVLGNYNNHSSPAVDAKRIYVASLDKRVYALDKKTGQTIWQFKTEGEMISSPSLAGNTLYVGNEDTNLYAIDCETGQLKWKFAADGQILCSPEIADGEIYFVTHNGFLYALH